MQIPTSWTRRLSRVMSPNQIAHFLVVPSIGNSMLSDSLFYPVFTFCNHFWEKIVCWVFGFPRKSVNQLGKLAIVTLAAGVLTLGSVHDASAAKTGGRVGGQAFRPSAPRSAPRINNNSRYFEIAVLFLWFKFGHWFWYLYNLFVTRIILGAGLFLSKERYCDEK